MPGRIIPLVNEGFYHIFNRGSDKRQIFTKPRDYSRFKQTFYYYQFSGPKPRLSVFAKSNLFNFKPENKKLVEIICYCLMPNHFHFLVRQIKDGGVSVFMSQLANSYTKYFNTKYNRVGPLFQGYFKAVPIETDEQLLHLSRYIHLNPYVSELCKDLNDYQWSSYSEFIQNQNSICIKEEILSQFPSADKYREFIDDQKEYGTTLEILKHRIIDEV